MADNENPKKPRKLRKGFILKADLEKIIKGLKQDVFELETQVGKEKEATAKWQRISFISWVLSGILILIPIMMGISKAHF